MDNPQILIIAVITTITIIAIIIGIQLIFLLKDLRSAIKKINQIIDDPSKDNNLKKNFNEQKKTYLYSVLNKINLLSFKINKKSFDLKKNI